ncbi:hypothetical protein EDB19DRAFT_1829259 [Suillus lakei]|nr:hypothetical protein EDB19DRAFT_1829259 [Suillus lakei]
MNKILDDIDCQGFKQWTGDNSKALMKVYIPAIEAHVPTEMVQALQALLDFRYIACCNISSSNSLNTMDDALKHFHSSFKRSAHQMGFCLNKLAASRIDFVDCGMLQGMCLSYILNTLGSADKDEGNTNAEPDADAVDGPMILAHVDLAKTAARQIYLELIADQIGQPNFTTLIQHFLHNQYHTNSNSSSSDFSQSALPEIYEKITLYTSAMATFFAPSDLSGIGGMRYERIRTHDGIMYPCALVQWFKRVADSPDEIMGMWVVELELLEDGARSHLIPIFGGDFVPTNLTYLQTLDAFCTYYVNNFIDHHAYEITF